MAASYPYGNVPISPIQRQIRLFHFAASDSLSSDVLRASFRVVNLDDDGECTPFFAISYTWGNNPESVLMEIDGLMVSVRRSAEMVLRRLLQHRKDDGDVLMWIDAICIDQESLGEKSWQVGMMGEIYSSAKEVLIWLGDDHGLARRVFSILETVIAACAEATDNFVRYWDITFPVTANGRRRNVQRDFWTLGTRSRHIIDDWSAETWQISTTFFSSTWFSRLWIAQEVLLAKDSQCFWGNHTISWAKIALAAAWISFGKIPARALVDDELKFLFIGYTNAARHAQELFMIGRGCGLVPEMPYSPAASLFGLLLQTNNFGCSEPKDRVYALLGLLDTEARRDALVHAMIEPDYELDVSTVFTEATKESIFAAIKGSPLTILKKAGLNSSPGSHGDDWPSWVPKFGDSAHGVKGTPIPIIDPYDTVTFGRPLEIGDMPRFTKVLKIEGYCLDTILMATEPLRLPYSLEGYTEDEIQKEFLAFAHGVLSIVALARSKIQADDRAIALTLCCGRTANDEHADQHPELLSLFQPLLEAYTKLEERKVMPQNIVPFALAIQGHAINRPFFITANGRIGMGPAGTKAGDRICFLFGHSWPFVLREVDGHWMLMGDVYVHDLMDVSQDLGDDAFDTFADFSMKGTELERLHRNGSLDAGAQEFEIH
ncbi:Heterokaryon incompatibility protein 6, OR allele [Pseudocercospora fuligena]|uniref:Heterokaryon incompatibility protein 6, OR allele n=1 Tax=Pseudocercospora fuligena TaxID=685502 RepID=A0A8H6RW45_9PEZI|nr:Heterokaryon incompatibility protein 6, OR allele [Pseudocercospora fuligena]